MFVERFVRAVAASLAIADVRFEKISDIFADFLVGSADEMRKLGVRFIE